jgi:hypothetical protein
MAKKNAAAVALGRKGGLKGGPARAARMTAEQRSESARNAVQARWAKAKNPRSPNKKHPIKKLGGFRKQIGGAEPVMALDTSDSALAALLKRLKATVDPDEIRRLCDQVERVVFHKQFENA